MMLEISGSILDWDRYLYEKYECLFSGFECLSEYVYVLHSSHSRYKLVLDASLVLDVVNLALEIDSN